MAWLSEETDHVSAAPRICLDPSSTWRIGTSQPPLNRDSGVLWWDWERACALVVWPNSPLEQLCSSGFPDKAAHPRACLMAAGNHHSVRGSGGCFCISVAGNYHAGFIICGAVDLACQAVIFLERIAKSGSVGWEHRRRFMDRHQFIHMRHASLPYDVRRVRSAVTIPELIA